MMSSKLVVLTQITTLIPTNSVLPISGPADAAEHQIGCLHGCGIERLVEGNVVEKRTGQRKDAVRKGRSSSNEDRKSKRLKSSHIVISYADYCLINKNSLYMHTSVYIL